jgi:uncharacterized protein YgbK (DUF1537 family)
VDATLLIPFFLEGGRYTIHDIHYVAEGDTLIPAAETPFAQDSVFGYRSSNLCQWVAEKTGGRVPAQKVATITVADLRLGGPGRVMEKLKTLSNGAVCVVNAASYGDMEVFVRGLLDAEAAGKNFVYRTAASFVRVRAGIPPRDLLTAAELTSGDAGGGLFIIGSYVPKTTTQLTSLLQESELIALEIHVGALLDETTRAVELDRAIQTTNRVLEMDRDVVIYTSRELVTVDDAKCSLEIGQRVSDGLVEIMRGINVKPLYVLAKGGITSSDIATKGLGIQRARVMGQILPGVPVWEQGDEARFPGMPFIVFPGNVGGPDALVRIRNSTSVLI